MKECHLWLLDGTEIVLKGETFDDLLREINNFFNIFKENVSYYLGYDELGYDDKNVIEQAKEEGINIEEV